MFLSVTKLPKDIQSMIKNNEILVSGIIFIDQIDVINDMTTRINQDISLIDTETWKVYEHYEINGEKIMNQLGFINWAIFKYKPMTKTPFLERRSDCRGYEIKVMTEEIGPFVFFDLDLAMYDANSQTYDVTYATDGMFYDMFMVIQEHLNFTATLHRRKDSQWGTAKVLPNGTIITSGIHASVTSGFAEMIIARFGLFGIL